MNARKLLDRVDAWQRDHKVFAFPAAVWKKYGDDGGGSLAARLTYYAFVSLFPLLLVFFTITGYVLHSHRSLRDKVVNSALSQFPIIGDQLKHNVGSVRGSGIALVIGLLGAIWGGLGVTQAIQDVSNRVWEVPRRARPGFLPRLAKGLLLLVIVTASLVTTVVATSLGAAFSGVPVIGRIGFVALATLLNLGWFLLAFRLLSPHEATWSEVLPGALLAAIGWQILLTIGSAIVSHQLRGASQSYGFFGIVLGLLAWLSLLSMLIVLAAEVNVVRAGRLWPRSFFSPDATEPDRRALSSYARVEERAPDQRVDVDFDVPGATAHADADGALSPAAQAHDDADHGDAAHDEDTGEQAAPGAPQRARR